MYFSLDIIDIIVYNVSKSREEIRGGEKMIKEAERAKKEMLDFLKKNESTGTAKRTFANSKRKQNKLSSYHSR